MWCFTVETRRRFALCRTKYVKMTAICKLIFVTNAIFKFYGYLILNNYPSTPIDQTIVTNNLFKDQLTYYINIYAKVRYHKILLMGKLQSKLKCTLNKFKVVQRTINYFSVLPNLKIVITVITKNTERTYRRYL